MNIIKSVKRFLSVTDLNKLNCVLKCKTHTKLTKSIGLSFYITSSLVEINQWESNVKVSLPSMSCHTQIYSHCQSCCKSPLYCILCCQTDLSRWWTLFSVHTQGPAMFTLISGCQILLS